MVAAYFRPFGSVIRFSRFNSTLLWQRRKRHRNRSDPAGAGHPPCNVAARLSIIPIRPQVLQPLLLPFKQIQ